MNGIDRVDKLWNSTENKLQQKEQDILKIKEIKFKIEVAERSLADWIQNSEEKLNQLLSDGLDERNEKILDDVKNDIPNWQQTLNVYQSLCYDLANTYSSENCQEVEENLERMNRHWSAIMNKLVKCSRETYVIKTPLEQCRPDVDETLDISSSNINEIENELSVEKLSGWLTSLEGQMETIEMGISRWRSGSGSIGITNSDKLKLKIIKQLNELQNEIRHYESQFQACNESQKNECNYQIPERWKILKEKVNEIKQTLGDTPESGQQLLTKLRLLNDWLGHKDADLLEQKQSPGNNYILSQNQLRKFDILLLEIETRRAQVEDTIEQAQNRIGEVVDPNKSIEPYNVFSLESEGESDNSDTGSNANTADEKGKRMNRRLRRHCHYLKRKWVEILLKSKTLHDTLKRRVELLNYVESHLKECGQLVSEIEFHIDSWTQVSSINSSLILQEMVKTKTLLQTTQHITERIDSVEPLRKQLQRLQVTLSQELEDEIEKIKLRILCIKSLCETRQNQLHQHETQSTKPLLITEITPNIPGQELPIDSLNSISRQMTFVHGSADNRKFTELGNESVSYPWERCLHPSGSEVPYYKNHSTQDTQWDHPIMAELTKSFDELNAIRFSAYRTAMKLRALQKTLCMDLIDLNLLTDTLKLSGLQSTAVNERLLDVGQIIIFLASLYRSLNQKLNKSRINNGNPISDKTSTSILGCTRSGSIRSSRTKITNYHTRSSSFGGFRSNEEKEELTPQTGCVKSPSKSISSQAVVAKCPIVANVPTTRNQLTKGDSEINIPVCVDLALNWLLNVYDSARNGKIRVLSLKVAVAVMSNVYLDEKYKYLFSLICNSQGQVDSTRLTFLLTDCILLPKHLNESSNFGTESVEPSVLSCFKNSVESNANRFIRLSHFLSWLKLEPQSLVWLPVLHRLISAEGAVHQARCGVCKTQPIMGLRYRCLRCFNFDLCQACFFYSKTGRGHKVSHPMQEYCNLTSSKESIRDYSRIIRNRFRSKRSEPKLGYLPVQSLGNQGQHETKMHMSTSINADISTKNRQIHSRVELFANRLAEVELLNRTHFSDVSSNMCIRMNPPMLSHDSAKMIRELNRNDEEHRLIAKYAETLRGQMRNDAGMTSKNIFINTAVQKPDINNCSEIIQRMPQFQKQANNFYATGSVNTNISRNQMFQVDHNHLNSMGAVTHQKSNNIDDITLQNGDGSLNKLIEGLETQKIQLLDEYERLQSQTPVNSFSIPKNTCCHINQGSRYATGEMGSNNSNRGTPNYHNMPLTSARTAGRAYGTFSHSGSLDSADTTLTPTELISEARMLREHKGKLENRMGQLEQRNRQLENQLSMLRHLIDDPSSTQNNLFRPPSNNMLNSLMTSNYPDSDMLTAAQYAASKRINEISCASPHIGVSSTNNNHFPGNSNGDINGKAISGIYPGQKALTSQSFYGSLERGSVNRSIYSTIPVVSGHRTPIERTSINSVSTNSYRPGSQQKAASDNGGSLAGSDYQLMCSSVADSCPAIRDSPTLEQSNDSIGSLFHMAGQVGKAVGQLVNVMTDEFTNSQARSAINSNSAFNEDLLLPSSQSIINNSSKHITDSN